MASQTWCQAADAPGRTILFAVNDSPESFAAFAWARANLLRQQDTLVLVHAYEKDRLFGASPLLEAQQVAARFEALCKDRGVQHRVVLAQGCAAKVVAGAAHANRCDMCVMGCRGLSAVKRALIGSVSSKVASACACPVMVIKRPRDEVGAFLTVLPRRVFFRIDSTAASRAAFDWATSYLLSPEIDEVFLMVSSRQQRPKAAGVGAWLQRGSRVTLQDSEAERIEIECMADYCQDTCIRKGLNASKVRLESGFFGDMLREAELKSCDLLVVGKERRSTREDAALYAAHNAPFPVIVVGDTAEAEHRIAMESGAVTRVVSAASRAPRQAPHPPPQQRPRTAGACADPRASQRRPSTPRRPLSRNGSLERMRMSMSRNSSAERVECTATLGPRSSSLERLLDTLADADHSAVMRSRRVRDGEEVRESECAPGNERRVPCVHQAAAGSAAGEDRRRRVAPGSSDTSSHDSSGSGGSRMRRVPTKAAFHASTVMPGDGNLEVAEVAKLSPSTLAAGGRDVPPALELGEPWMRGTNGPAAMLAM